MTQKNQQEQYFEAPVEFADQVTIGGNEVSSELAAISGLLASAAELNRVADVSTRLVTAGDTLAVTVADHDNKIILLSEADGSECTLPDATGSGAIFRFFGLTPISSSNHIIQVAASTDDEFLGEIKQSDTDTSDADVSYPALPGDDFDQVILDGTDGGVGGDWIEVIDVAAGTWAIRGHVNGSGTVGTPFASTITS